MHRGGSEDVVAGDEGVEKIRGADWRRSRIEGAARLPLERS